MKDHTPAGRSRHNETEPGADPETSVGESEVLPGHDFLATDAFDYELPEELIAQRPEAGRTSRLLVVPQTGACEHHAFSSLPDLLRRGDLLVYNDTQVVRARLHGSKVLDARAQRSAGNQAPARVEILLVERLGANNWRAMLRPARRFRQGGAVRLRLPEHGADRRANDDGGDVAPPGLAGEQIAPVASVTPPRHPGDDLFELTFDQPLTPLLARYGSLPLPPYIQRPADARDDADYQTIFARRPGAVAAPTAGLHFGPEVLAALERAGIDRAAVTLHVGPGTFRPIATANALDHAMHSEWYEVPSPTREAIARARRDGGRIVAVGTTVVRTLEAAALTAAKAGSCDVPAGAGRTAIYITPGFRFRVVDALITNFHLPRSTLLLLVSAFSGQQRIRHAYREAITRRYRFYSYGDAMLLERAMP